MAVAAEAIRQTSPNIIEQQEKYAESMAGLRRLAALACDFTVTLEFQEKQREVVFDDFTFAVAEMAATDPDYRDVLDVDHHKRHPVIKGMVCTSDGEPMVEVIARGEAESWAMAKREPAKKFQSIRDGGDKYNALRVDELPIGWTRLAPSMDPKKALREYPEQAKELGYKEGMMYWQRYSRSNEATVETGSHSVDASDLTIWRGLIEDFFDVHIPEDVSADEWIYHGIELECSAEEADQLVRELRNEYYQRRGVTEKRHSVSEYVAQKIAVAKQIFDAYYPSLAEAVGSGSNNETMSDLAAHMLKTDVAKKLKSNIRQQLILVANSKGFSDEMGRTMNSILRYVTVEELRKGLPSFLNGSSEVSQPQVVVYKMSGQQVDVSSVPLEILHQRLAANLQIGVEARRSYSGCAGQIELSAEDIGANGAHGHSSQEAFGGKSCPEVKDGQITKCPHCKKTVRAIVPNKETIYCSNKHCKLAAPDLANKK